MNSFVNVVFVACVLVTAVKPFTDEEKRTMLADVLTKCTAQESPTESDFKEVLAHQAPTSRTGQCFKACIMENIGIMKDGKFSVEQIIKEAEMSGNIAKVKNAETVGKECQSVGGSDRCENVPLIMQCVKQAAAKLGIDPLKDLLNVE